MAVKRKRDSVGSETLKGVRKTKGEVDGPKVHPRGTALGDLPYDIVNNILLKLPIKSVLICKCVCQSWHSIISDPRLAQLYFECAPITALVRTNNSRRVSRTLHLLDFDEFKSNEAQNLSSDNDCGHVCSCKDSPRPNCHNHMKLEVKFKLPLRDSKMVLDTMLEARKRGKKRTDIACKPDDDKFNVVNSCNGLLCLWNPIKFSARNNYKCDREALVVCNPITGEFIRLPQSERLRRGHYIFAGLGYLKKTNEYKVIQIMPYVALQRGGVVEVHTLGTRSWRSAQYRGACWNEIKCPTCLNGSLHWLVYNFSEVSILCFDLESETLNPFPCPSALSSIKFFPTKTRIRLGELKGSLYICCPYENAKRLRFWTMKKYGDGQSWTEVLSFNMEDFHYGQHFYQPIVVFGGLGILIYDPSRLFIYYDPQKHLCRFLEVRGTSFELEPIFHIPNLTRLKDIVKEGDVEVLNVHSRCATFKLREDEEVLYLARCKADMRI